MICRIATHAPGVDIDSEGAKAFRAWMKEQPGLRAAYQVRDPDTGRTLSISIWDTKEQMLAMKDRTPPGGAVGIKPASVEFFSVVHEF
jgi:heme-degrading monooxygenase HmoA